MNKEIVFTFNGRKISASSSDTILQVAKREGIEIPHLCYSEASGYRPAGNCRTCMVEIEGERVLASSCNRSPTHGMVVSSTSSRANQARSVVMELLLADQPSGSEAHDPDSELWQWAHRMNQTESRFPRNNTPASDSSHPAMLVNLDACIHCTDVSVHAEKCKSTM